MKSITIRILPACLAFFVGWSASAQTRTLRIVTYNIEADTDGDTAPLPGLIAPSGGSVTSGGVLEGIGEEIVGSDAAQPLDILALEETTSNAATVTPIVTGLNSYYNAPGMYTNSTYQATESGGSPTGGNGPNAIVYNTKTIQLIASVPVDPPGGTSQLGSSSGEYREVMRYEFAPAGVTTNAANLFYIYVSHYKADPGNQPAGYRLGEARIIRTNETSLPANARVLYVGDYNPDNGSDEPGYQTILSNTAPNGIVQGGGIDPMNLSGATNLNWSNGSLISQNTEATTSLQYRDDLQVMTTNVYYGTPGGLAYVPGTYHVFGNNGTTAFGGNVSSGNSALTNLVSSASYPYQYITAAQLYTDLTTASDHLPVVADYTIPLTPNPPVAGFTAGPTNGTAPLSVVFTNLSTGATNYSWAFGDGNTSTLTNAVNTYTNPGAYSVTLTAVGPGGTNTLTLANYIVVAYPPPVAGFTAGPTNGTAPLSVVFTNLSTGATNYSWAFGDGNTSTLTNAANTYTNPGAYSVTLTAVGPGGTNTLTLANYIVVTYPPPVAGFTAGPTNGTAPLSVVFTNLSTGATNYSWAFGDGNTSTLANPANTYTNPGAYTVTLTAVGPGGTNTLTLANYIVVTYPPPVAGFTAGPTNGTAPLSVAFTNLSTGATNYAWAFGDGNTSTLANPANTYTNPGAYTVTLTAVGPGGTSTLTLTNYIVVAYPPPVAGFTAGPTNGTAPLSVAFTNLSAGATNYSWAFGDGNTSTLTNPVNNYANPGAYSVALTAVGPGGTNTLTLANYILAVNPQPTQGLLLAEVFLSAASGFQFIVTNADGTPVTEDQQSRIAIYAAIDPSLAFTNWTVLPNSTLLTNGLLQVNDTNSVLYPQRFYRAVETP
jgi:PKD repeat protein